MQLTATNPQPETQKGRNPRGLQPFISWCRRGDSGRVFSLLFSRTYNFNPREKCSIRVVICTLYATKCRHLQLVRKKGLLEVAGRRCSRGRSRLNIPHRRHSCEASRTGGYRRQGPPIGQVSAKRFPVWIARQTGIRKPSMAPATDSKVVPSPSRPFRLRSARHCTAFPGSP